MLDPKPNATRQQKGQRVITCRRNPDGATARTCAHGLANANEIHRAAGQLCDAGTQPFEKALRQPRIARWYSVVNPHSRILSLSPALVEDIADCHRQMTSDKPTACHKIAAVTSRSAKLNLRNRFRRNHLFHIYNSPIVHLTDIQMDILLETDSSSVTNSKSTSSHVYTCVLLSEQCILLGQEEGPALPGCRRVSGRRRTRTTPRAPTTVRPAQDSHPISHPAVFQLNLAELTLI